MFWGSKCTGISLSVCPSTYSCVHLYAKYQILSKRWHEYCVTFSDSSRFVLLTELVNESFTKQFIKLNKQQKEPSYGIIH